MDYDNWQFTIKDKFGKDVECDIISVINSPDNSNYSYIVFNDGSVDANDNIVFMYAKMYKDEDDDFVIENDVTEEELAYIKQMLGPDITNHILEAFNEGE